jgi:hypothetical protein
MPTTLDDAVRSGPRVLLRLEGAVGFCALTAAYAWSGHSWWLFGALFFVPDLSTLAYLVNTRVGAAGYNTAHTLIGPGLLGGVAFLLGSSLLPWLAVIWAAHIGFDRMIGYGLKYSSGFRYTHLGTLGATNSAPESRSRIRFCRA